mmetsp:Transcript_24195/g.42804  ORF Transcript_24195/g.42804 Transcript_24195/m.42804 type:complete len:85 (+) Transcript_24195:957-1211(+)
MLWLISWFDAPIACKRWESDFNLRYISETFRNDLGDQSLSATAAALGQIRDSTVSAEANSVHIQASPPITVCFAQRLEPSGSVR